MIYLKNGCARSEISVTPKNWNTGKASLKKKWKISYRYYDPAFMNDPELWGKQIPVRGMNRFKDLEQKQEATRVLLEGLKEMLDNKLFNPITGIYTAAAEQVQEISPSTPFIEALKQAKEMINGVPRMLRDIKSAIGGIEKAAGKLYDQTYQKPYSALKISQVSRKHLIYIFQQCKKDNPRFSANRQNKYRTYLLMLFKELLKVEAVGANPVTDIPIEKGTIKKKRQVLTESERLILDTNLKAWDYYYWRYVRIFFRSGSRSTEMLALQPEKVDLASQEFIVLVKKGQQYVEQVRPIPDDILPLWIELINEVQPGQYLFSIGFKPGAQHIGDDNVGKRWRRYVKNTPGQHDPHGRGWGMGIKKDFYSLKHLNADMIAERLDIEHAAAADGHTNTETTRKHYAVNEDKRRRETLKKVSVKFI